MRHYCSLLDATYLAKGLALYVSMEKHCQPFHWHVLALDDRAAEILSTTDLPSLSVHRPEALEAADPRLLEAKANRRSVEYIFTLKAFLPRYLFDAVPDLTAVTLIDADAWFFADPEPAFAALPPGTEIGLSPHRFPEAIRDLEIYGRYNAGWVHWQAGPIGLKALAWYQERVLEWCKDIPEGPGRFAEQGYLQDLPALFGPQAVASFDHPGLNSAPWNLGDLTLSAGPDGRPFVNGQPILYHHFHGVRRQADGGYSSGLKGYEQELTDDRSDILYQPYLLCLIRMEEMVSELCPDLDFTRSRRREEKKAAERQTQG
ncbi:MAG: hypothetical protein ACPGOY_01960 [Rhodospirillaceae bacterium]